MLRHLKKVVVKFSPGDPRATSVKELYARLANPKSQQSNPNCVLEADIRDDNDAQEPSVEFTFADNDVCRIGTADFNIHDIMKSVEQKASLMEMQSTMKEIGFDPWKPQNRLHS